MIYQPSQKKIPTLLAIVMLVGLVVALPAVNKVTSLFSRASSSSAKVENLLVTNITESSWTVSWTTPTAVSGMVYYGRDENASDGVAVDQRNVSFPAKLQKLHVVTVSVDRPGPYYYRIGVGSEKVGQEDSSPYLVILPNKLSGVTNPKEIVGKVVDANESPVSGALVVFRVSGAQTLSSVTSVSGEFTLSLDSLRNLQLSDYFVIPSSSAEIINVVDESLTRSTINCVSGLENRLQNIKLGQGFNCDSTTQTQTPSASQTQTPETGVNKFKSVKIAEPEKVLGATSATNNSPKVLGVKSPQIVDPNPMISGFAIPGQTVLLTLDASKSSISVKTGTDGKWHWISQNALSAGKHSLVVKTKNKDGSVESEIRDFVVSSALNVMPQVLGTPSAIPEEPVQVATPVARPVTTLPQMGETDYTLILLAAGAFLLVGAGAVGVFKF